MGLKDNSGLEPGGLRNLSSLQDALFDVAITNTNSPINPGDTLVVDYSVDNTGGVSDTQEIRLEIDSVQEHSDAGVFLVSGDTTTGTLEWVTASDETAQDYTATVLSADDSTSQTVTVESGSAIPDSVAYQWAIDETGGQTLNSEPTDEPISLNFEDWVSDGSYFGGWGVDLNGVDDQGSTGDFTFYTDQFSFAIVYDSFTSTDDVMAFTKETNADTNIRCRFNDSNETTPNVVVPVDGTSTSVSLVYSNSEINDGNLHSVIASQRQSDDAARLYFDGVEVSDETEFTDPQAVQDDLSAPLTFGDWSGDGFNFPGRIVALVLYDEFLTASEANSEHDRLAGTDSTPVSIADNAHGFWNGQIEPHAQHYNGVTYFQYPTYDTSADTLGVDIQAYDHSSDSWTGPTTVATGIFPDQHYHPAMAVDSNGFIYIGHSFRSQTVSENPNTVLRSDAAEDISSFTEVTQPYTNTNEFINYIQLFTVGTDVHILSREGGAGSGSLVQFTSTDDGSSWTKQDVVSVSDRGIYPVGIFDDGTFIHGIFGARISSSDDMDYAFHIKYERSTGDWYGTDGTQITLPITGTDLSNASSIIADQDPAYGGGICADGSGNPQVAFVEDNGAGGIDAKYAQWDGTAWQTVTLETDVPETFDSQAGFEGYLLAVDSNGSDVTVTETINGIGGDPTIGQYISTDGGSSFSSRSTLADFVGTPVGHPSNCEVVRDYDTGLKYVGVEYQAVDPSDTVSVWALDSNGEFIV